MTASYDIALHDLAIHTAITVDMKPYPLVDVGRCPDSSEPTFVGQPPPERLPYVKAVSVLPDLDTCTADDISDLAANVCSESHVAADDLYALCGSSSHVKAICEQLGATEMALSSRDERIERLGQTTAMLSTDLRRTVDELAIAQGVGAALQRKLDGADRAVMTTAAELYAERNKVVELDVLLRTERQRLEREATMHHQTMSRLIAQTGETCKLHREVSRLTEEVRVLREKCERGGK
jgi:hypothetical protein